MWDCLFMENAGQWNSNLSILFLEVETLYILIDFICTKLCLSTVLMTLFECAHKASKYIYLFI